MNAIKRPLSVTIVACLYIVAGIVGVVYHFTEFRARHAFQSDDVWVELIRILAIICGAFMLRGHNWARWLALAWIAFHVVISAFHSLHEFAFHAVICAVIAWILLRPAAARYFRAPPIEPT
jgi:hypothetical protein